MRQVADFCLEVLRTIWGVFIGLADFFGTVLGGLFGRPNWQAPAWAVALATPLIAAVRAKPRQTAALVLTLLALGLGGRLAWRWYESLPKPQTVAFKVEAPERTCYECEAGAGADGPWPLTVRFEASVSPLDLLEKEAKFRPSLIEMRPAQPGVWRWSDDKTLVFEPSKDWPVGAHYSVRMAKKGFVARQITLAEYGFEFSTAPFTAKLQEAVFDQDPVNPVNKTAVASFEFSHPLDTKSFEQQLALERFETITDSREDKVEAPSYTVNYDAKKLHAYVRTAQLAMPGKGGRVGFALGKGVKSSLGGPLTLEALTGSVSIPGRYALAVNALDARIARDVDDAPVQLVTVALSHSTTEAELASHVQAWLLPLKHPDPKRQREFEQGFTPYEGQPYRWSAANVGEALLAKAEKLLLQINPIEEAHAEAHSFGHKAPPGRWMVVRVTPGMKSFGGYELAKTAQFTLEAPQYPQELRLTHKGALLALSGAKKLTVFTRDLPGIRVEVGRLLPNQLQHLVSQTSGYEGFDKPNWENYRFDEDNLTEHLAKVIPLAPQPRGTAQYEAIDMAPFLADSAGDKRGIFFLRVQGYDPAKQQPIVTQAPNSEGGEGEGDGYQYDARTDDTRLVVVTDLGLVVKRNKDRTQEVFMQSIATGEPLAGVEVQVIAKNGEAVVSRTTDAEGHATLPELSGFKREKTPVLYLAKKGGDQSFLPMDGRVQNLDFSRFDVGGVSQATEAGALSAFLFSDRGIYRPGEGAHFGVVVKATDFAAALPTTPLDYEISDPRGATMFRTSRALPASGFDELAFSTRDTAPTGQYSLSVYLPQKTQGRLLLGSLDFTVREFQPDRLKMALSFSTPRAQGWVNPKDLSATANLQNLFGTPAQNRRVVTEMRLSPWLPAFAGYSDYLFNDPQTAKEGFAETLADATTGEDGTAQLALNLGRFAAATYRLHLTAQGFEPDGGRGVTAEAQQIVSALPYLVGWKADGSLDWVNRNAARSVRVQAISPEVQPLAVQALQLKHYERKWLSVLVRRNNGTYQYESRQKDVLLSEAAYAVAAKGEALKLATATPGNFFYLVTDAAGQVFARIPYTVAGSANLSRSLEKNAELTVALSKKDYQPGEEVSISLTAPYTGAGLITIEREKVLAYKWFKASTTASVQTIKLPEGLEGSAYVQVLFTRDLASEEIYTSPLSYGVAAFSVALDARRTTLNVESPAKVKPGETVQFKVTASRPGKAVVYAIDEGILQVARYTTPQPLEYFFQKRSLDVETQQILDLILPEFRALVNPAAPGGDADGALGRHLNPFKRKGEPPVAYWSGIVDVGPEVRSLAYTVPESFNGSLRVMAVSVAPEALGRFEGKTLVRGDFTLLPNAPLAVAPGDIFEVSTGVANNLETGAKDMPVKVELLPSSNLEVLGAAALTLPIGPQREGVARFQVRAKDAPGAGELAFAVSGGGKRARLSATLSVRPATPYRVQLSAASIKAGSSATLPVTRDLYPHFRKLEASVSPLPLALARGLTAYLNDYPYACTEQLVSMAVPALVLSQRPDFGKLVKDPKASMQGLLAELATRQTADGDFRLWPNGESSEFVSIYAAHFLLEAGERNLADSGSLLEGSNRFLTALARRDGNNLEQERNSAYAIYLLTRQGQVMSAEADALLKRLQANWKGQWEQDATAAWLAAAYGRMQQAQQAEKLISKVAIGGKHYYDRYHGPMSTDAELLYVLAKHFPQRLARFGPSFVEGLVTRISKGEYQSLSAATSILALDAYASVAAPGALQLTLAQELRGKGMQSLALPAGLFPSVAFSPEAVKLKVGNASTLPAYALTTEAGFDRQPPAQAVANGFEIVRSYLDKSGKPVSSVKLGDEVQVRLKFRSVGRDYVPEAAIVDLLPGGFEIVQAQVEPTAQTLEQAVPEGEEGEGDSGEEQGSTGRCGCAWVIFINGYLTYADYREDRAVFYADIGKDVTEISYTLKAVAAGKFTIPPAYGEAMYDRSVYARALPGVIEVVKP